MTMPLVLRFRLYPSREQEARMLRTLESCRHLWNDALSHRRHRWQNERKSTSYNLQQWILTAERRTDPELGTLYSQIAQDVLRRLDRAFQAFFEHHSRYPRFKKFSQSGSFTYPQAYNGSVKPDVRRRRLFLSRIGNIPIVFHRQLPKNSRLKTCTVVREPDGRWFASLVFEEIVPLQNVQVSPVGESKAVNRPLGVDLGLFSLITTSDGEKVEHPRLLRKREKRLKRVQHTLSRRHEGSNNWFKARLRVASQHAKVRRQRVDFNHKLSMRLVRGHDFIAFEDLKVRNMIRNHRLAKSIVDAGWGQLMRFTEYKAALTKKGAVVVKVSAAYSSHECAHCGALNNPSLNNRQFECVSCHRLSDRDFNAAWIVLKRGLAKVGQGMPQLKPAETGPLLLQSTGEASPVDEPGTTCAATAGALKAHGLQSWEDAT